MSMTSGTIRDARTLARTPLFASLGAEDIRALDSRCLWRRVPAGEWVIDYQADGQDVFFVFSGHARVIITTGGREMILRDIREGEYFGQYSAIDGKPRSAAIQAVSDTVVARMSAALFWEAIHHHPGVREGVLKELVMDARRLNERATEHANFDHRVLNLDRAPYGIDNAAKFHECAIACAQNCFGCPARPATAASSFRPRRPTPNSPRE